MPNLPHRVHKTVIFFIVFIGLFACKKEITTSDFLPCGPVYADSLERSDTWKSIYVFRQTPELFVFKNSKGDSVLIQLTAQFDADEEQRSFKAPCEEDSSIQQKFIINGWHNHRNYQSFGSNKNFQFVYHIGPEYIWSDRFHWYEDMDVFFLNETPEVTYLSYISLAPDEGNTNPHSFGPIREPVDEYMLGNRLFYSVYISEDFALYYTHEQGIIAFLDEEGELWIIDRIN